MCVSASGHSLPLVRDPQLTCRARAWVGGLISRSTEYFEEEASSLECALTSVLHLPRTPIGRQSCMNFSTSLAHRRVRSTKHNSSEQQGCKAGTFGARKVISLSSGLLRVARVTAPSASTLIVASATTAHDIVDSLGLTFEQAA